MQALLIVLALAGTIIAPPRAGAMLILPIAPASTGETLDWALASGASILGRGPVAGSLIVWGERAPLAHAALVHASVLTAAPFRSCGEGWERRNGDSGGGA